MTMWSMKVLGAPEDKLAVAQVQIDKHLDETTLSGQLYTLYDKWRGKIRIVLFIAGAIGAYYVYNRFFRRRR